IPVEDRVNIFINSFGSIQETTMDYRVNIFPEAALERPEAASSAGLQVRLVDGRPQDVQMPVEARPVLCQREERQLPHDVTQENILLFIFRNGDVLISMRLSVTLSCPLDLTLFPMDTQRCKMQLESFGYTTDDLQFMWQSGDPVQMDEIALPQFDIRQEDIEYGNCTKFYAGTGYYTCVEVIFTLRRQVGFYMMGVYAPTLLIVVLSWLSFWINPDASAARVPLGILSVLSLSSECTSLASELPKVSYVKAIDIWLIACLLFGFASLVEYAVVQVMLNNPKRVEAEKARLASREKAEGRTPAKINSLNGTGGTPLHVSTLQVRPPRHVSTLQDRPPRHVSTLQVRPPRHVSTLQDRPPRHVSTLQVRPPRHVSTLQDRPPRHVAETRCKKVCTSKSDLRSNDFSIVGSLPRDFELSNFDCYGKPIEVGSVPGKSQAKNGKKPVPSKPVIPSAAKRIDLYSRAIFPFSFLFFNIIYWSVYL
ncbi:hypothetical protein P4O66_020080, partial [Electrophorus voltai]